MWAKEMCIYKGAGQTQYGVIANFGEFQSLIADQISAAKFSVGSKLIAGREGQPRVDGGYSAF